MKRVLALALSWLLIALTLFSCGTANVPEIPDNGTDRSGTGPAESEAPPRTLPVTLSELPADVWGPLPVNAVSASSSAGGGDGPHRAEMAADADFTTCWAEGTEGIGAGEYLDIRLSGEHAIASVAFCSGSSGDDDFRATSRPQTVLLGFSDGQSFECTLEDSDEIQTVHLPQSVPTDSLRVTICSAYSGFERQETSLTEIMLYSDLRELIPDAEADSPESAADTGGGTDAPPLSVPDTVTFGAYEQNGNASDGMEPIEWYVLDTQEDRMLLLSRNCLNVCQYENHAKLFGVTWENSALRTWLDHDFYGSAFTEKEKERILTVVNRTPANPETGEPGGPDTEDRVFALSSEEAEQYLTDLSVRRAKHSDAINNWSLWTETFPSQINGKYCAWWLRTPSHANIGTIMDPSGAIVYNRENTALYSIAVRPAIWVSTGAAPEAGAENDLVTEILRLEETVQTPDGRTDRVISIPQIRLDSPDVKAVNLRCAERWQEAWKGRSEDGIPVRLTYRFYQNGDILSLVISETTYYGTEHYYVENIRVSDSRSVSGSEILTSCGLPDGAVDSLCRDAVKLCLDDMSEQAGPSSSDIYRFMKSMADSRDFSEQAVSLYLGENGSLHVCCTIDWFAGSGQKELDLILQESAMTPCLVCENAAALWRKLEAEGGRPKLAKTGDLVESFRQATKWVYTRVLAEEGLVDSAAIYKDGALTIGAFMAADPELAAREIADLANMFSLYLLDDILGQKVISNADIIYSLFRTASGQRFLTLASLHADYHPDTATEAQAAEYIRAYYAAQIDYATVLAAYLYFDGKLLLCHPEIAAYSGFRDTTTQMLSGSGVDTTGMDLAFTLSDTALEAASPDLLHAYQMLAQGDTQPITEVALNSDNRIIRQWGVTVRTFTETLSTSLSGYTDPQS